MLRREFLTVSAAAAGLGLAGVPSQVLAAARPALIGVGETFISPEWLTAMDLAISGSSDRGDRAYWRAFLKSASATDAVRPGLVSLPAPGVELFEAGEARTLARRSNDQLAELARRSGGAVRGLATISARDEDAAGEAARAVDVLGLSGVSLSANRDVRLNDRSLWPLYDVAQAAGVAIYLPARYSPSTLDAPYRARGAGGVLAGAAADSAAHANQLIFGGVLDAFPKLNFVLARLGEGAPYWHSEIVRTSEVLRDAGHEAPRRHAAEYFETNLLLTTADMVSADTAQFCRAVIGADRVLRSVHQDPMTTSEVRVARARLNHLFRV